ncbi:MAG: hypothetical protein V2B14_03730 [bacterium]
MNEKNQSVWAQEVQYEEINQVVCENEIPEDLMNKAYEAFNRFYQKEQRRNKSPKRKKPCWQ